MQCNQYSKRQKQLSRLNPNIHFLIAGIWSTNKSLKGYQKQLDSALKNYNNVTWITNTPRDNMPDLYGAADIALIPGLMRDGMSMALAESLSCGLPVIATNRGTYPEIIKSGYSGTLCNPENLYIEVIQAIEVFFGNDNLLQQMGGNARTYAVNLSRVKNVFKITNIFSTEDT